MNKIVKLLLCCFCVMIVGCKDDLKQQETLIQNYFTYLKDNDLEKMNEICSDQENANLLKELNESWQDLLDEETYGKVFVGEVQSYIDTLAKYYIDSYKIDELKRSKDGYTAKLSIKVRNYSDVIDLSSTLEKMMESYQELNKSTLENIYKEQGYQAMMYDIYGGVAQNYFTITKNSAQSLKPVSSILTIKIIKKDNKWLINEVY